MAIHWPTAMRTEVFSNTNAGASYSYVCGAAYVYGSGNCTACAASDSGYGEKAAALSNYVAYIGTSTNVCNNASFNVSFVWDGFGVIGNNFELIANGATIYSTGCVATSGSATVAVPAGTHTITWRVFGACNLTGDDIWSLSVQCL